MLFVRIFFITIILFSGQINLYPVSLWHYGRAVKNAEQENWQQAHQDLTRLLAQQSSPYESATLLHDVGVAAYKNKSYQEALSCFSDVEKSVDVSDEQKQKAWFNAGNAAVSLERFAEAIEWYDRVLQQVPHDEPAQHNREYARKMLEKQREEKKQEQDKKEQEDQQQQKQQQQQKEQQSNGNSDDTKESGSEQKEQKPGGSGQQKQEQKQDKSGESKQQAKQEKSEQEKRQADGLTEKKDRTPQQGAAGSEKKSSSEKKASQPAWVQALIKEQDKLDKMVQAARIRALSTGNGAAGDKTDGW